MSQLPRFTSAVEMRRSPRLTFALPVKIRGRDASGAPFTERTHTVDVNERGGRLQTHNLLRPRDRLYIENPMLKQAAMATIAWVGRKKSPFEPYEVGIALDQPQNLWGIEFPNAPASLTPGRGSHPRADLPPGAVMAAPGQDPAGIPPGAGAAPSDAGRPAPRPAKLSNPAALRRSTRLTISVPVIISGLDAKGVPFSEQTRTIGVNKHGGKLHTRFHLRLRDPIYLENPKNKVTAKATVAWVGEGKEKNDPWEVGVALDEPQNIWGIDFPPDDWEAATPIRGREKPAEAASAAVLVAEPPSAPREMPVPAAPLSASDTQVGVAPPVLVPFAPPQAAPARSTPAFAAAPLDAPAAAAQLSEQMKLLAEAHSRLFQREFADLATGMREKLQQEVQSMIESAVGDAAAKARHQMQQDLEQFACQLTEMEKQVTEACVNGLRKRLAAMLATLETPPSRNS